MAHLVGEVMTTDVRRVSPATSVLQAALTMRLANVGAVLVVDDMERLVGILTDRDIVVRVVATGRLPETTRIYTICSRTLTTISPKAGVAEAVRLMREKAIRRLPVVDEEGRVVGILSLGDVAVERDRHSALADISRADSNV